MRAFLFLVLLLVALLSLQAQERQNINFDHPPPGTDLEDAPTDTTKLTIKCCNVCPEPNITVVTNIINKKIVVHIPYPVLKPYPGEGAHNETCPDGYDKIAPNKCMKTVIVVKGAACAPGFIKVDDYTCARVIVLKTPIPIDQVECPPGMKRHGKIGCVHTNKTIDEIEIGTDIDKPLTCPSGYKRKGVYHCVKVTECPKNGGWINIKGLGCVPVRLQCPRGYKRLGRNKCVKVEFKCPEGTKINEDRTACIKELPIKNVCPEGYTNIPGTLECVLTKCLAVKCANPNCPAGSIPKIPKGECCAQCVQCACSALFTPVCGGDNVTYPNECVAECLHANIVHSGPCNIPPVNVCSAEVQAEKHCNYRCQYEKSKPVCTEGGVTFKNLCLAKCHKKKVTRFAACPAQQPVVSTPSAI